MTRREAVAQCFMGAAEVAVYCGVSRQCLSNWRKRGGIIEPHVTLRMGPVWLTRDIIEWWDTKEVT